MEDDKIDLQWGKFLGQLILCFVSFMSAIYANQYIFGPLEARQAIAETAFGPLIGALMVMGTFFIALWALRVPYRKDMFERRLRNWAMTYAAVMVLTLSVAANIGFQKSHSGEFIITPYIMPALWLLCYLIYSQYTRYCVAHNRRNSFIDGSGC